MADASTSVGEGSAVLVAVGVFGIAIGAVGEFLVEGVGLAVDSGAYEGFGGEGELAEGGVFKTSDAAIGFADGGKEVLAGKFEVGDEGAFGVVAPAGCAGFIGG